MGKQALSIETLHGYTIEELKLLRKKESSTYAQNILNTVVLRYGGMPLVDIASFLMKSPTTIGRYIKEWNSKGISSLVSFQGKHSHQNRKFSQEMIDHLINTLNTTSPNAYGLLGNVWTCALLAEYLYQVYGEHKFSPEYIRQILHKHNFSYKRAQAKPTKGDKVAQDEFKKNAKFNPYCRVFF